MVGMILYAKQILQLLFPNATSGAFIYQISCISIIFVLLEQTIGASLHGIGKVFVPAVALAVGGIVKLILNLILVPINTDIFILGGTAGAALATAICHIIAVSIEMRCLKKSINIKFEKIKFIIKPLVAVLVMSVTSKLLYEFLILNINSNLSLIISIFFSLIIYIFMVFFLRIFSKEEIFMIPYGQKLYKNAKK